jgi:tetratricopeptide (TPR) repeat protein
VWTTGVHSRGGALDLSDPDVLRDLNQLVEQAYRSLQEHQGERQEQQVAALLCWQGIQRLVRLREDDVLVADRLFSQAFELEPRGIYLAWRAFLRTFQLVEFMPPDRKRVADEAIEFMRRALELDPGNSYVAGFSAQVHSIVRQSYVAAYEMAELSVQLNPANAIGWTCLGIAAANLGKPQVGFEHTLRARVLSAATPFRFFVNALGCIVGSMSGDIDKAIFLGEASHGLAPTFKPPMRFLSALYLLRNEHEAAQQMVEKLRVTEPGFSYDVLRDRSYPASSLQRSKLLEKLPLRQV